MLPRPRFFLVSLDLRVEPSYADFLLEGLDTGSHRLHAVVDDLNRHRTPLVEGRFMHAQPGAQLLIGRGSGIHLAAVAQRHRETPLLALSVVFPQPARVTQSACACLPAGISNRCTAADSACFRCGCSQSFRIVKAGLLGSQGNTDGVETVLMLAHLSAILPRHAYRVRPHRGKSAVVDDPRCRLLRLSGAYGSHLCRRLCHTARTQMRQINTLGDQTRVLPCGFILRVSA
jgi:hypothetical protein